MTRERIAVRGALVAAVIALAASMLTRPMPSPAVPATPQAGPVRTFWAAYNDASARRANTSAVKSWSR